MLISAAALAFVSTDAVAATTIFTDQSSFEASAGTTSTEDFSDANLVTGLSISSGTGSVTTGAFRDRLTLGTASIFTFASPQSAFGGIFDLSPGGFGLGLSFSLGLAGGGTETISQFDPNCTGCFFGFTSTNPFLSVSINPGTGAGSAETYNLDNLQFASATPIGAVPEPGTWAMLLLGFGLIGAAMRSAKGKQKVTLSYA